MSTVASVHAVTSSRPSAAVYGITRTHAAKPVKAAQAAVNVRPAANPQAAATQTASAGASSSSSAQSGLPLGYLLSVAQPPSSNVQATMDYQSLQSALHSDNAAAAQEAYLRLQSDLLLFHSAAATSSPSGSNGLNTVA